SAIGGVEDIFITKYDNAGIFQWSNQIGGADRDIATSITVDKSGNAYLTGSFKGSVDFDPGPGIINQISIGTQDAIFFAKYDSFGGYVVAKKLSGSAGSGVGTSIAVDTAGKFYLTGAFSGTIAFDPMGGQIQTSKGVKDLFYAKYNQLGEYEFAYPIGAPATSAVDSALGSCIVVDNEGDIYITGSFQGDADFDPSITVDDTHTSGSDGGDIFFAKYDNAGNYLWAKSLCAGVEDAGTGIAVDTAENVYITGYYQGTVNFDVGAGIANRVSSSNTQDIFFAKYRPGGTSTISGNVFDNIGNPVTAGYVYLYTQYTNDGNAAMHLVDITSIQTGGDYSFSGVYEDSYLVLAIADSLTYPFLAATYFSDSTHWEQATPIVITSPFTTFSTATINMRGLLPLNGSASLGGVILEGFGYDRVQGEPIVKIPIGLEGDPGSIIAYTSTDIDGKYTFNNLPAGCYKIYVNIPGLP
ncbi:MAG: SBBP repeat-containing protein, partial [Bacteroidota bacterium]|nr:SBBP repeat-containing protein [Bacteroidota bacterium]